MKLKNLLLEVPQHLKGRLKSLLAISKREDTLNYIESIINVKINQNVKPEIFKTRSFCK